MFGIDYRMCILQIISKLKHLKNHDYQHVFSIIFENMSYRIVSSITKSFAEKKLCESLSHSWKGKVRASYFRKN